ncbi:MAG: hypothetical protein KF847_16475 [Pirellulales bacterium]|nr:hypothetical protein [Pirellulales bacterium]
MQLSPEQLEWIVAEVVRRLREQGLADGAAPAGELVLAERVVTVATVSQRLGGVARVRVARGAVVTPAARDLLKDHGVALVRED